MESDTRTPAQIREHYVIERELAARLRSADKADRRRLYSVVYDELFQRVPLHPQLTKKASPEERAVDVARQVRLLRRFVRPGSVFLELGAGDCAVSIAVASQAAKVYAVDVSQEVMAAVAAPSNVELVVSDGVDIDVSRGSVDVAYSHQLMEHLHPDDAREQLANVLAALAPGGAYVCLTPNRLSGPHDVSKFFDDTATGFHLKEYTLTELDDLFRDVGFTRVRGLVGARGFYAEASPGPIRAFEAALVAAPSGLRRAIASRLPFRALVGVGIVAKAPG